MLASGDSSQLLHAEASQESPTQLPRYPLPRQSDSSAALWPAST